MWVEVVSMEGDGGVWALSIERQPTSKGHMGATLSLRNRASKPGG